MEFTNKKQKTLFLLCGCPGSGKSTWVREHMNSEVDVHISRDVIRFALISDEQDYFAVENLVRKSFFAEIENHTADECNDYNIFIDATHITPKSRAQVRQHIKRRPYQIAVSFEAPLEVALERNKQRTGRALVPDSAIYNMYNNYEKPTLKEGFDEVWHVNAEGIVVKEVRNYE